MRYLVNIFWYELHRHTILLVMSATSTEAWSSSDSNNCYNSPDLHLPIRFPFPVSFCTVLPCSVRRQLGSVLIGTSFAFLAFGGIFFFFCPNLRGGPLLCPGHGFLECGDRALRLFFRPAMRLAVRANFALFPSASPTYGTMETNDSPAPTKSPQARL